jgi:bacteriorhodopsin
MREFWVGFFLWVGPMMAALLVMLVAERLFRWEPIIYIIGFITFLVIYLWGKKTTLIKNCGTEAARGFLTSENP